METKAFNRLQLYEFVHSQEFKLLKNIPISFHRAVSQINNPRADDLDILLVVTFDNNQTVGYLGILPDYIFENDTIQKMGWLTCFWVDDAYKSKNIAANLFLRVIKAWDQRILITNIVPWLEPVYQKTKIFKPTIFKTGFRGYLRFNFSQILPPKRHIFGQIKPILKFIDGFLNIFQDLRLNAFSEFKLDRYEYIDVLDKSCKDFIEFSNKKNWNKRTKTELDWILMNPWILESKNMDLDISRYYFSSIKVQFKYKVIKFYGTNSQMVGLLMVCVRDGEIRVPYIFAQKEIRSSIAKFIINLMMEMKLNMVTVFEENLANSLKNLAVPFYFKKEINKPYLISKKFQFVEELNFQDGDGDGAFY